MGWTRLISGFIILARIRSKRLKKRLAPSHDLRRPIQSRYAERGKRWIRSGLACNAARIEMRLWSMEDVVALVDAYEEAKKPMDLGALIIG
jgi:hypothetical protein